MKTSFVKRAAVELLRALGLRDAGFAERSLAPFRYEIDHFYTIENEGYVVHGWILDNEGYVDRIELTDGRRSSEDLLDEAIRRDRPDVRAAFRKLHLDDDRVGFLRLVPFSAFARQPLDGLHLRFVLKTGRTLDLPLREKTLEDHWDPGLHALVNATLEERGGEKVPERNLLVQHDSLESLTAYVRIAVDSGYVISGGYFFISGWIVDPDSAIASLVVKQGDATSEDVRKNGVRYARPDLQHVMAGPTGARQNDYGISALLRLDVDPHRDLSLYVETVHNETLTLDISGASQCLDVIEMSKRLLAEIDFTSRDSGARLATVGQAIRTAWQASRRQERDDEVAKHAFGTPPDAPQVSVIVPLYGRWDFMEYQISQFAIDPDFRDVELIYVVDDPTILDPVLNAAPDLHAMFGVAFTVVFGGRNRGFAGANNLGASFATADTLLLLNSDVIPKSPGWLSAMKREHDRLESPGAIAPALLYEDESVQHAGMTFEVHPEIPELFVNVHEYKGLPGSLVLGRQRRPKEVLAVTAACLMIGTQVFAELGGLDERYILGDFEDSDLCLKALEKGYKNYFLPMIELYHVERQSQNLFENLSWRQRISLYNCWEHTEKWGDSIRALKAATADA